MTASVDKQLAPTTPPPSPQSTSILLSLVPELRLAIFQTYFFSLSIDLISTKRTGILSLHRRSNTTLPLSLLSTSHQLRHECLPLLRNIQITVTALFAGWHQVLHHNNPLGIPPLHATYIRSIHLQFLDSNFHILKSLPNLEHVYITPPGETQSQLCKGNVGNDIASVWTAALIHSEAGNEAMKEDLMKSMNLMFELLCHACPDLRCKVHYSVGFKFRVQPMLWSSAGRLVSRREDFCSVRCEALGHYDSEVGTPEGCIEIISIREV